jgi:hypothetical protein
MERMKNRRVGWPHPYMRATNAELMDGWRRRNLPRDGQPPLTDFVRI